MSELIINPEAVELFNMFYAKLQPYMEYIIVAIGIGTIGIPVIRINKSNLKKLENDGQL